MWCRCVFLTKWRYIRRIACSAKQGSGNTIRAESRASHRCRKSTLFLLNPNRSLDPEQISLDCWADGLPWGRRRSGLRRERTKNKMPTRKWKMTGSYLFNHESYYNGLMTDLGLHILLSIRGDSKSRVFSALFHRHCRPFSPSQSEGCDRCDSKINKITG